MNNKKPTQQKTIFIVFYFKPVSLFSSLCVFTSDHDNCQKGFLAHRSTLLKKFFYVFLKVLMLYPYPISLSKLVNHFIHNIELWNTIWMTNAQLLPTLLSPFLFVQNTQSPHRFFPS
jgi:hypothetical protein